MFQLPSSRQVSRNAGRATHTGRGNDCAQRTRRLLEPHRLEGPVLYQGWKDPYSTSFYSQRQGAYAQHFGLESVYTPQMVVDGTSEFVGSSSGKADKAFRKALSAPKLPLRLSAISADASNILRAHLETGALDSSFGAREADVYVAVALNRAESQVSAGENSGHRLAHVSVVKSLTKIGTLNQGQVLTQDVHVTLEPGSDARNLRLIAFVQEPRQGRVFGAASMPVSAR